MADIADVQSDAGVPVRDPIGAVIEVAACAVGVPVDPVRFAEARRACPGDDWGALEALGRAVSLELSRWCASVADAVAASSRRSPLVLRADGAWLVLLGPAWGGARVWEPGRDPEEHVATIAELTARIGGDALPEWGVLEPSRAFDPGGDDHTHVSPWSRLSRIVRLERADIRIVAVYAVAIGALSLTVPIGVQALVNTVVFGTVLTPLLWLSVLVFGGLVFAALLQLAQVWVVEVLQRRVFVNLVAELSWRLPRTRLEAVDRAHGLALVNRFFDVVTLQKALASLLLDGMAVLVSGVTGTVLLALYHPYFLAYAALLWVALLGLLRATGARGPATAVEESYAKHAVAGWIEELAANPTTFRTGGGERWARTRADALATAYLHARAGHFRVWFRQVGVLLGLYAVASTLLLALGGALVIRGQITIGQLMAAELVVSAVLGSFAKLGKQLENLYDAIASMDKVGHLLELPLEESGGDTPLGPPAPTALEVRAVTYAYEDEPPIVADVSLNVRAGEKVALVSTAGSGKRTLMDLLIGLRAPSDGWIRFDGVDLRELRREQIRARVALVRGAEIVDGTIADNVHFGRPEVGPERVRRALSAVGLLDDVAALPEGTRTRVSPNGRPLSGSQARRLSLARALAGEPGLLLVDDLLDALAPEAQRTVVDALLACPATVILCTRDPEVAARCDRVVELERPTPAAASTLRLGRAG